MTKGRLQLAPLCQQGFGSGLPCPGSHLRPHFYSQASLSSYHCISQLDLFLIKSLCLEDLIQRNPAETGGFDGLRQASFAMTALSATFPESSEEEFDRHKKILSSRELQISLRC